MALAKLINLDTEELVEFNAVPAERKSATVDATSNPIELIKDGKIVRTSITDHISVNPNQFNIDAVLSNYDQILESYQSDEDIQDIVKDKLFLLEKWKDNGDILRYEGHNIIEDDVIIIDLDDEFTVTAGDSVKLKITLFKIKLAQVLTRELNIPSGNRKTQKIGRVEKAQKSVFGETEADSDGIRRSFGFTGSF